MNASTNELCWQPATELARLVRGHEVSPTEIAGAFLGRIEAVEPLINAFGHHDPEQVLRDARDLERRLLDGESLGPLAGVPFTVKDLHDVAGVPTTLGTPAFADAIASISDIGTQRLLDADALFVGKTNTAEIGWNPRCKSHMFGPTQNPWDVSRTPGGSSGGSAAAVAAGMAPLGDGSDAGGSIRIPASFCGLVGYKASFGTIPFPFHWYGQSTLHRGPITRTVDDAALMASTMSGAHLSDPMSLDRLPRPGIDAGSARVAISVDAGGLFPADPDVRTVFGQAMQTMNGLLDTPMEESFPAWEDQLDTMTTLNAASYGGMRHVLPIELLTDVMDEGLLRIIEEGSALTAQQIGAAQFKRTEMWRELVSWFEDFDLLVIPTLPCTAFDSEREHPPSFDGRSREERHLGWLTTYLFNLMAPCPVISVPCGWTDDGLPVGLSIVGGPWDDESVLSLARAFEAAAPWADRRPEIGS